MGHITFQSIFKNSPFFPISNFCLNEYLSNLGGEFQEKGVHENSDETSWKLCQNCSLPGGIMNSTNHYVTHCILTATALVWIAPTKSEHSIISSLIFTFLVSKKAGFKIKNKYLRFLKLKFFTASNNGCQKICQKIC